ncbi:acyl-CoA thioesterase [Alkalicoccus chagannorensis]|uniref:acyl-CoA thioesterase n=1 Tax=Alkalicoccus chagannorensis TaxID=427072 RepID=UPI000429367B|nr:thioesterase family protein [Alkalicoccus chagannorensis]
MKTNSTIQVRYAETDQMGVVYHANYLVWCEIGRTDLMKQLGIPYREMEEQGMLAPVTNIQADYRAPARYGDTVTVETWVEDYTGVRVVYGYSMQNEAAEELFSGRSEHVLVNKTSFRPAALKKAFPEWHRVYEMAAAGSADERMI